MSERIRIFSYLPNPRVWKSLITGRLGGVKGKVLGDKPKNLVDWLWDFDAVKLSNLKLDDIKHFERQGKRGFEGSLYKTNSFLDKHPFGTVPAGFNNDGSIGIFESNSIMRAVARSSTNTTLYGDNDPYLQSRIDSFLDANLVFSREFQVYVLELKSLNDQFYNRMKSAYSFYMAGIENALSTGQFVSGPYLTIADVSFVCDVAQFLRERDPRTIINEHGYEIISKNFEEVFPKSRKHLMNLYNKDVFQEFMKGYLDGILD